MFKSCLAALGLGLLLTAQVDAQARPAGGAQQLQRPPVNQGWQIDAGLGVIAGPQFLGTESYRILPVPYFDIRYGQDFFFNVPQGLGGYVVNHRDGKFGFKLGGAIAPNFGGRDADDIPGLPEVDITFEGRAYAEFSYGAWSFNLTAAQALAMGHEGFYADAEVGYGGRLGQRGFYRASASVRYADDVYMDSFYRIGFGGQSAQSGLLGFNPDGGFESVAAQFLYGHQINRRWRFALITNARHAVSDARISPITDETNLNLTVISALTYRF